MNEGPAIPIQSVHIINETFWASAEVQQALERVPVQPVMTKEEYDIYNALPIWFNKKMTMERAQRRNVRKVL